MFALARVKVHFAAIVELFEANVVICEHLLVFESDQLLIFVPDAEPGRFSWHDHLVFCPHPEAKCFYSRKSRLVDLFFGLILIVDPRKESVFAT